MSDIWCVNGKMWYSAELVDKVVDLCKNEATPYKQKAGGGYTVITWKDGHKLAKQILELLEVESEE